MITVNGLIRRMSPKTMISLLGDLIEMDNLDVVESELVSLVAGELVNNVGEDAFMLLSEANVEHPIIDDEIEAWMEELEGEDYEED